MRETAKDIEIDEETENDGALLGSYTGVTIDDQMQSEFSSKNIVSTEKPFCYRPVFSPNMINLKQ